MSPLNLSSLRTNLSGGVRAVEQLEVPVVSDRQGDLMKAAQVFEDVLDARVELGHKRGGGRLHASGHVSPQRFQLVNTCCNKSRSIATSAFSSSAVTGAREPVFR